MFKKTITYTNFDDVEVTKDFYFHLTKTELIEMTLDDSMRDRIKRITETQDKLGILKEYKALVRLAIGVRSEDGETFIKDEKTQELLMSSPAFDELLLELMINADAGVGFIRQLIPEKMQEKLRAELEKAKAAQPDAEDGRPAWQRERRAPTDKELQKMSRPEMAKAMRALQVGAFDAE